MRGLIDEFPLRSQTGIRSVALDAGSRRDDMNEASDGKAPHRPWHGLAARAMMGLVALALMIGTISVLAVQSFNELRQSFNSVAYVQIEAIETAAELRQ